MKEEVKNTIVAGMIPFLTNEQLRNLMDVVERAFIGVELSQSEPSKTSFIDMNSTLQSFLSAKQVEGCSEKTISYYSKTIQAMLNNVGKIPQHISTEDLRLYLTEYQINRSASKVTIDNIRRILSSFFSWLEDEDFIIKSPVRRIHKVKTNKVIKDTYSDETLELIRDSCDCSRDLALIDLLASSGIRIGELVNLNRDDINFNEREFIVFGKGGKERQAYFDARTKIHLQEYINARKDENSALFVSLKAPYNRLTIGGIGSRLHKLGEQLNIKKVHPHKFRRTMATSAIDKGMPIEQVQRLLGHQKIDTTLHYAMVKQSNVKIAHRRFLG